MNPWNIPETQAFWISNNMLRLLKSKSGSNIFFSLWIQICLRTKYSYPRQIEDIWIFSRAMVCQIWQIKIEDIQLNLNCSVLYFICNPRLMGHSVPTLVETLDWQEPWKWQGREPSWNACRAVALGWVLSVCYLLSSSQQSREIGLGAGGCPDFTYEEMGAQRRKVRSPGSHRWRGIPGQDPIPGQSGWNPMLS